MELKEKVMRRKRYSDSLYIINKLKYGSKLNNFTYNSESCPICLIGCSKEEDYIIFHCKHFMHVDCVMKYNKCICPICNICISGMYKTNKNSIIEVFHKY